MKNIEEAIKIAKDLNELLDKYNIYVPILNDLKIVEYNKGNCIFAAVGNGIVEQFLTDGVLKDGENIDNRISDIQNSLDNSKLLYHSEYKKEFNYKIYLQDIGVSDSKVIRQINAYFIDKNNKFFQISIAIGPFNVTDRFPKLDSINNLEEDSIIRNLYNSIVKILDDTCYIDDIGGKQ